MMVFTPGISWGVPPSGLPPREDMGSRTFRSCSARTVALPIKSIEERTIPRPSHDPCVISCSLSEKRTVESERCVRPNVNELEINLV